jgi:hypothetical protein
MIPYAGYETLSIGVNSYEILILTARCHRDEPLETR